MSERPWPKGWLPLVSEAAAALSHARGRNRRAAALVAAGGGVHSGVSITVSDPAAASMCAEQTAVAAMCVAGGRDPSRIVVISAADPVPPCGRCLQVLMEFGDAIEVGWGTPDQLFGRSTIARLLPMAFRDYRGDR
jgi:cytidine deaminase